MSKNTHTLDELEVRPPQRREASLMAALPEHVAWAKRRSPAFGRILADVDPAGVTSRAALAQVPITRKAELHALQKADPPFGGLTGIPNDQLLRIFASPGPIYDPQGPGADVWHSRRALFATGFRKGDIVQNCLLITSRRPA